MTNLEPNTIEGLLFGMRNFDSIETDVRLTSDNELVIFHDPDYNEKAISNMSFEECLNLGIPSFAQLLEHQEIQELTGKGRKMWIEFKPNCKGKKSVHKEIASTLYQKFAETVNKSGINKDAINILSFQQDFLYPVVKDGIFPAYRILPYVNECNDTCGLFKGFLRIFKHSLKWHIKDAIKKNFTGILVARQYLMGITSILNPSYEKLCELMDSTGIEIGSNLGRIELEKEYPRFHRFTDKTYEYPRFSKKGEGLIVAHRGTGTKGIKISD